MDLSVVPGVAGNIRRAGRVDELYGSTKALSIAAAADQLDHLLVVVTTQGLQAEQLGDEVNFYSSGGLSVLNFPDWETLPYDRFSPYQDITSERLATLARLSTQGSGILIVAVDTLMQRLPPTEFVGSNRFDLRQGEQLDRDNFRHQLESSGYRHVNQVLEHGDYSVRGSLVDIFPMGSAKPFRIDLFDEEIDVIRIFDPETQRSAETVDSISFLPAREFPLTDAGIARFRSNWRVKFPGRPGNSPLYTDVSNGLAPAGIEYYLPLFFEHTSTLFDYLPDKTTLLFDEGVQERAEFYWSEVEDRYESYRHDSERPVLAPSELFLDWDAINSSTKSFRTISICGLGSAPQPNEVQFATAAPVQVPVDVRAEEPFAIVRRHLAANPGRVLFVAESNGRRETIVELFAQHDLKLTAVADWQSFLSSEVELGLTVAPLHAGVELKRPNLTVITESQLFGERASQRRRRRRSNREADAIVRDLTELEVGAPVVHEEHGVGRYLGLVGLDVDGVRGEYIYLEYADGDKLYVPVGALHLISRYSGIDPERAPLHKLGSAQWQKAREKAAARATDVAAELLEIHARRAARHGYAFKVDHTTYQAFVEAFPFEETPDQESAIEAVKADMMADTPMDRLICGDSGFGKTEVAMRAAFVSVMEGRQVAVLVPTTLLAQQHHRSFQDRFADWPVRVEQISRLRSRVEQDAVLSDLRLGKVDIVVGTHRLLQESIEFQRLGLLIIDEEHRFGVRQKERLKAMRSEVDILTLTATPIPRTLNMALSGIRELSLIATPPSRRLAVKTFVQGWDEQLIREALLREIRRGGQVYFLHNEVESIEKMVQQIEALVPEARIRHAHGQMRERDLERTMLDFYHRRFNVLVCSTIIETGIDIPTANTIIINRADRFGLAQLYQLRGRVGRSHHRAYAYLLVPERRAMTADAIRRLEAIESLEDLGIGFTLATHDLEIRGAGEILGDDQSGHIEAIGFGLYSELLTRAVTALKAGLQPQLDRPLDHGTEIDLHTPALIPESYLPDVHTRLIFYKRIASSKELSALQELREEMIDRFGLLPSSAQDLFKVTEYKLKAAEIGIKKIDLSGHGGRIVFDENPNVDPGAVIDLVQKQSQWYRFDGKDKLRVRKEMPDVDSRFTELETLLMMLSLKDAA